MSTELYRHLSTYRPLLDLQEIEYQKEAIDIIPYFKLIELCLCKTVVRTIYVCVNPTQGRLKNVR